MPYPSSALYPATSGVYPEAAEAAPAAGISVRELPPLRQSTEVITPSGRYYRWADDEPNPANVPSGIRHSSTMPGGYETSDLTLPRKPGIDYSDLDRLTTIRHRDASGDIIGEYRLERAPRVSGDQMAISPSAVGWQAHLEDDKSAREIYVDRNPGSWGAASITRRHAMAAAAVQQGIIDGNATAGGLEWAIPDQSIPDESTGELVYSAPAGCTITKFGYKGKRTGAFTGFETPTIFVGDDDAFTVGGSSTTLTLDDTVRSATLGTPARYGLLRAYVSAGPVTPASHVQSYSKVAVYGNHGLTTQAITGEPDGVLPSDVVAHAVGRWAPLLTFTVGETILASSFILPHLTFPDATTAGEIVRQASRFDLPYWAVWDNREFHWDPNRTPRKRWRARIAPTQLEETGPQMDRLWNSIIVQYQDVDGSARTVGPVGSGADTEDAVLYDDDPDNPANQLGIIRRDLLVMGVGTAGSATELGRRFLEQTKLLDTSGRARIVGHIIDDHGIVFPYTSVRAGDTITFVDASDTSERRIVRADHDRPSRSCSVDLDAPPDGLAALLERLGVVLIPLSL